MDREGIIRELKAERDRLDNAIQALETGGSHSMGMRFRVVANRRAKRTHRLTPAGRRKLSMMMKKRGAECRKQKKAA